MRRCVALASDYARRRVAFGRPLAAHPLHVETLAGVLAYVPRGRPAHPAAERHHREHAETRAVVPQEGGGNGDHDDVITVDGKPIGPVALPGIGSVAGFTGDPDKTDAGVARRAPNARRRRRVAAWAAHPAQSLDRVNRQDERVASGSLDLGKQQ